MSTITETAAKQARTSPRDPVALFEAARAEMRQARRNRETLFAVLFVLVFFASAYVGEVSIPVLVDGMPNLFNYLTDIAPTIRADQPLTDIGEWYWRIGPWLGLLLDTLIIAFLGTLIGAVFGFLLCFPATRTLVRSYWIFFVSRRVMEVARGVPDLVYAMMFVFAFGLGALPGVLAIAVHSTGALGKLYSEVNENVDLGPLDGVRASGGNWFEEIRFGIVPQVLPNFLSYTLLRFEINVRSAAVIGFVGAGGIGQELMFVIRQFVYTDISAIVLMILAMVSIIDISCEKLRHRMIEGGAA